MATRNELEQAYLHNIHYNQIGGMVDGISEDVAADLGFATYDQALEITRGDATSPAKPDWTDAGESMTLARRDELLAEAFAAAALAKKAQGRARNVYNRGQIAHNMGTIESNEVNGHGRAMLPEHMTRLNSAMLGLMGDLSGVPAMPGDNKRTANDFIRTYYGGTKESEKARAQMKRAIEKRKRSS